MCHVILHRDDATNIWRALDISTAVGGLSLSVKGVCVPSLTPTSTLSATLSSLPVGIDTRELNEVFVNLTIENTQKNFVSLLLLFAVS